MYYMVYIYLLYFIYYTLNFIYHILCRAPEGNRGFVCVCLQSKHKRRGRTRPHRLTLPLSTSLYTTRHSVRGGCRGVAEPLGFPTRFKAGSRKADPFFIP